eukprot:CAMPEP_0167775596 /NCGR_PEP_ID=MMETSP0111_2-20121227/2651_1 /TAXON_ID=91324 /ORGANISM="Lotharella globosa, Strain CCCM811" /LENGTH=518 /DNA_ID=CAMNT_0007665537 /DNA_START=30 /DNA_END=1586 /DNA_ORIENTATION=+
MGKKEKIVCPEEVKAAIAKLRSSPENQWYLVVGYSNANTLTVVAEGKGGLAEAKAAELFPEDKCRFCLLRAAHKVEMANTIKFAFIDWTPTKVKPLRRGLLTTHKGQVQAVFNPYHVWLECSHSHELDPQTIADKIGFSSGTAVYTREKKTGGEAGYRGAASTTAKKTKKKQFSVNTGGITKTRKLKMAGDDAIPEAVKAIRSDSNPLLWMLVTYANDSTLQLHAKGETAVQEMCDALTDDQVYYAFFRVEETFDANVKNTVKFGFVQLICDKLSPVFKGKLATHRGFVTKVFDPYHEEFLISSKSDISESIIRQTIQKTMFTDRSVLGEGKSTGSQPQPERKPATKTTTTTKKVGSGPRVPLKSKKKINFTDSKMWETMMASVRSDAQSNDWLVSRYVKRQQLQPVASGEGGWPALEKALQEGDESGAIQFALLRVVDQIDNSSTIKFVYFKVQPKSVKPMLKGFCNTDKGKIDSLFAPYHVDFFINEPSEISFSTIMDKVGSASGSKSHVKPTRKS